MFNFVFLNYLFLPLCFIATNQPEYGVKIVLRFIISVILASRFVFLVFTIKMYHLHVKKLIYFTIFIFKILFLFHKFNTALLFFFSSSSTSLGKFIMSIKDILSENFEDIFVCGLKTSHLK